jgi:hypothetical protein
MRTKHPRVRLLAVVLSVSALLAAAAPVFADEPELGFVDIQGCYFGDGQATVPAGADFFISAGWLAESRGQEMAWLNSVQTTLTFDGGAPIAGADTLWSPIFYVVKVPQFQLWITTWDYRHAALGVGESITVYHAWSLRVPVYDGTFHFPKGLIFGGTCTITGVAPV